MDMKRKKQGIIISAFILVLLLGGIMLNGYIKRSPEKPPELGVLMNGGRKKTAVLGTYAWKTGKGNIIADADHPANFEYDEESTLTASRGQKIYMHIPVEAEIRDYAVKAVEVYKPGSMEKVSDAVYFVNGDTVVLDVTEGSGDYVYMIHMDYGDNGDAYYGIHVLVDHQAFDIEALKALRTPYVGDAGKVGDILHKLPVPGSGYLQRFLRLQTVSEPYGIVVYYEPLEELRGNLMLPEENPENEIFKNMEKNALVLLSLVENAGKVTFKVRQTSAGGELEDGMYPSATVFKKDALEEKYGNIKDILDNRKIFTPAAD